MSPAEAALHGGEPHSRIAIEDDEQMWLRLKGVAARRGEVRAPRDMRTALAVVADLSRDARLIERLATECLRWSSKSRAQAGHSNENPVVTD